MPPANEWQRNCAGCGDNNGEVVWKVALSAELTLQAPEMLLVLESCFLDEIDCTDLLENVPIELLLKWVVSSCILLDGLNRMNYWERYFQKSYSLTYQRLCSSSSSHSSQERALSFLGNYADTYWRGLCCLMVKHQTDTPRVWKETIQRGDVSMHARYAVASSCADEFGLDNVHQLLFAHSDVENVDAKRDDLPVLRTFAWNASSTDFETLSYFDFNKQAEAFRLFAGKSTVVQAWSVPFADACMVLFQNQQTGRQELVWVTETDVPQSSKVPVDLRYWTLNQNVLVENDDDFIVPAALFVDADGDDGVNSANGKTCELRRYPVLVATTENCTSVVIGGNIVLVFDKLKKQKDKKEKAKKVTVVEDFQLENKTMMMMRDVQSSPQNWRQSLLTEEFLESNRSFGSAWETTIAACCYVLDACLLVATNDGVLRAHPRSNPKSEYFVENLKSLVPHMTSLYNVVAIVHSYHVLEVRQVTRKEQDPFIHFTTLYQTTGVDCDHPPLLYGPYVIFAGLDGCWYRVKYDGCMSPKRMVTPTKEAIATIPHHPGWKLLSVKSANWRYWVMVAQDPVSKRVEELFLFQ